MPPIIQKKQPSIFPRRMVQTNYGGNLSEAKQVDRDVKIHRDFRNRSNNNLLQQIANFVPALRISILPGSLKRCSGGRGLNPRRWKSREPETASRLRTCSMIDDSRRARQAETVVTFFGRNDNISRSYRKTTVGEPYKYRVLGRDWTISHHKLDRVVLCILEITPGTAMKPIVSRQRPP
jgi:hypothetical protein